jgi:hypothetical protein
MLDSGTEYVLVFEVCVSRQGQVERVRFRPGADPRLEGLLKEAVFTWRYRPLLLQGVPRAFCHPVQVTYR